MNKILKGALIAAAATVGYFLVKEMTVQAVENTLKEDKHVSDEVVEDVAEHGYISLDEIILYSDASQFSPKTVKKVCSYSVTFTRFERAYFVILGGALFYLVHSVGRCIYVTPYW